MKQVFQVLLICLFFSLFVCFLGFFVFVFFLVSLCFVLFCFIVLCVCVFLFLYNEFKELQSVYQGGRAATFDLAASGLYMFAPVKKSVNHSKTLTSMREVQGSRSRTSRTTREYVFFVRGDSIVGKEFVFSYCLLAVSIFYDSTEFEHHIS